MKKTHKKEDKKKLSKTLKVYSAIDATENNATETVKVLPREETLSENQSFNSLFYDYIKSHKYIPPRAEENCADDQKDAKKS